MAVSNLTRRDRESRAYTLVLASGGGAVATVVALVLAIAGVIGGGLVILFAVITAVLAFALRRTLGR